MTKNKLLYLKYKIYRKIKIKLLKIKIIKQNKVKVDIMKKLFNKIWQIVKEKNDNKIQL